LGWGCGGEGGSRWLGALGPAVLGGAVKGWGGVDTLARRWGGVGWARDRGVDAMGCGVGGRLWKRGPRGRDVGGWVTDIEIIKHVFSALFLHWRDNQFFFQSPVGRGKK